MELDTETFDRLTKLLPEGVHWSQELTPVMMLGIVEKITQTIAEAKTLELSPGKTSEDIDREIFPTQEEFQQVTAQTSDGQTQTWLRWPGGSLVAFDQHSSDSIDSARCAWAVHALNMVRDLTNAEGGEIPIPTQDPKYSIFQQRLINQYDGTPIPFDEPVFMFRARDKLAEGALLDYVSQVTNEEHAAAVRARIEDFRQFAKLHPARMKMPDTQRFGDAK